MTFRNREEHFENFASSEAPQFYHSEHLHWEHPLLEEDYWNQSSLSVSFGECSLVTSPDTISECTLDSDCSDMGTLPWSPTSSPPDWAQVPTLEHSAFLQSIEENWRTKGAPVTTQSMPAMDTAAWLSASEASVDLGLSRALSHESSSTRTLNSFSKPDVYVLPPSVDFPFTAEPAWHGSFVYTSPDGSSPTSPNLQLPCSFDQDGLPMACSSFAPAELYPGSSPVFFPHGGQAAYSRNIAHTQVAPMRPILPRTASAAVLSQPAFGPQRILRPSVPGCQGSQPSVRSVSNVTGLPQEAPGDAMSPSSTSQAGGVVSNKSATGLPSITDPTAEDFTAFIRLDQEDRSSIDGIPKRVYRRGGFNASSLAPDQKVPPMETADGLVDGKPVSGLNQDLTKSFDSEAEMASAMSLPSETEEGRHRTHPDYSKPPHSDGQYRCPYKAKEGCSHKPTKLKCNYDKYIDSHVKPFRCKLEACAKQEFSSTACLLRHEREAHGMHGHGDKPHLCYYPGCERGVPGSGFPRRYNLFDHMKRVHDHKEDAVDSTGSPILGGETQKKIKGAKRKPSSPLSSEPAVQRQKTMALSQHQCSSVPLSSEPYYIHHGQFPYGAEPAYWPRQKQKMSYSQWAANGMCQPAD